MKSMNKLYDPADFLDPSLRDWKRNLHTTEDLLKQLGVCPDVPVEGRYWEYGQGMRAAVYAHALTEGRPLNILEVGGSDSIFMPTLMRALKGSAFTGVETPEWLASWKDRRNVQCPGLRQLAEIPDEQFDYVACISVIEHVQKPMAFMEKLCNAVAPGGVLFLTSDIGEYPEDDYMFSHMRSMELFGRRQIWTPESWRGLGNSAIKFEFVGPVDFTWNGPNIYGSYSFASMALRKQ